MSLSTVIAQTLKSVDREIARLITIRVSLASLDHDTPIKRRHFSVATRKRMSIAQRRKKVSHK
jgi:hypothetical protein